jgi:hypothetical protein
MLWRARLTFYRRGSPNKKKATRSPTYQNPVFIKPIILNTDKRALLARLVKIPVPSEAYASELGEPNKRPIRASRLVLFGVMYYLLCHLGVY